MNELALFAGAGGGILGGQLLGWRTVCAVERDAYPAAVLAQRQNEGLLDLFPIWSDITTFDGKPWRGIVDVVSGGFPCQDISVAGKGAGIDGERSGLWGEMARIIDEVRPPFVFVENSPALTLRGLGRVLGDLAALGYDAEWGVLAASDVGAPHKRERIWILGHSRSLGRFAVRDHHREHAGAVASANDKNAEVVADSKCTERRTEHSTCERLARPVGLPQREKGSSGSGGSSEEVSDSTCLYDGCSDSRESEGQIQQPGVSISERDVADTESSICQFSRNSRTRGNGSTNNGGNKRKTIPNTNCQRFKNQHASTFSDKPRQPAQSASKEWRETGWATEPNVGRVANGVDFRVDRLKALGNGQVPKCAAEAWCRLMERIINV